MIIEGRHIYLRLLTEADATEKYLGWLHDQEVTRYLRVRHSPPASLQELRDYIGSRSGRLFLAIILKDGDRHIGNIKLGHLDDVGILIGERDEWGKGYGSEAIRLLTKYAFSGLGRSLLWAGCHIANTGSRQAFVRAGWTGTPHADRMDFSIRRT